MSLEGRPFTSNFITGDQINDFIATRGYDNPFSFFENGLGLSPWSVRSEDTDLPRSAKKRILDKGANARTIYSIKKYYGIGMSETRIIIFHNDGDVVDMTSRAFSTGL